jgi:predicted DNA-binding protein with PD1-like motif
MVESTEKDLYGRLGKIVTRQLPTKSDLVKGIKQLCADNEIRYGAILTTVGSLRELAIEVPGPIRKDRSETVQKEVVLPGPMQVLSLIGVIFENADGEMDVHIHGSFLDAQGKIHGGHLIEGKNPILARMVVVIGEVADVSLIEGFDEESRQRFVNVKRLT